MKKCSLIAAVTAFLGVPGLLAHSLHQSTAEMEWKVESKRLEVSLTVFVNDLELALIRQSEREMRIDRTPAAEFDAQIVRYLAQTFLVTNVAGKKAVLTWVGREMEAHADKSDDPAVTLFFEIPLADGLEGAVLHNGILHDLFGDQENLLLFRIGEQERQMLFKRGDAPKKLDDQAP